MNKADELREFDKDKRNGKSLMPKKKVLKRQSCGGEGGVFEPPKVPEEMLPRLGCELPERFIKGQRKQVFGMLRGQSTNTSYRPPIRRRKRY